MIVFSRPPGWRRRAGDVGTSSSGADALRWPRKATLRAALRALRTLSRGPCDAPPSRRTTLLAEEPARPSDVSPFDESKYWAPSVKVDGGSRRNSQIWRRFRSAGAAEGHPPCQRGLTIARRRTRSPCLRPDQAAGERTHHRIGRPIRRPAVGGLLAPNSGSLHTL